MPAPAAVVTATSTVPAVCAGVTAVMVVALTTVTAVAAVPPMVTAVAPVKLVPVMVTGVPPSVVPLEGAIDVTVGTSDEDPRRPDAIVVVIPAHDGGVAVGGQRDGGALLASPTAPVPTSLLPCWVQTPPLRV